VTEAVLRQGDLGTPERHNRGELVKQIINDTLVSRVSKRLSFETLYARKTIGYLHKLAAEQLYENYINSHPRNSCEYREPVDGGGKVYEAESQAINRDRFERAIRLLDGQEKTIILAVVIYDSALNTSQMGSATKRKRRTTLQDGLMKLAKFYHYC
jgi:hypothetical protein